MFMELSSQNRSLQPKFWIACLSVTDGYLMADRERALKCCGYAIVFRFFDVGIAVAPVTTWRYYDNIYTERFMRTPQENPEGYDDNSPINFTDNLQGKLLLVHGTAGSLGTFPTTQPGRAAGNRGGWDGRTSGRCAGRANRHRYRT